jgi:hypothetical protein
LRELQLGDDVIAELRMRTAQRADLAADRTGTINRLRGRLLSVFLLWNGLWTSPTMVRWC